jgi:hypothetical protein
MKTFIRKIRIAVFVVSALMSSVIAIAADRDSVALNSQVDLKLVGHYNDQSIFQLTINGPYDNDVMVIVRDVYGYTFYKENVKTEFFSRKFLFNSDELGDETLQLEIFNRKTKQSVVYEINKNYRNSSDVVITKK